MISKTNGIRISRLLPFSRILSLVYPNASHDWIFTSDTKVQPTEIMCAPTNVLISFLITNFALYRTIKINHSFLFAVCVNIRWTTLCCTVAHHIRWTSYINNFMLLCQYNMNNFIRWATIFIIWCKTYFWSVISQ